MNNKSLKTFFIALLFSVTAWSQQTKDVFRWGTKDISWEDYKGSPKVNWGSAAVTASLIHMSIEYPTNQKPEVTVETLFNRSASWAKSKTPGLLLHEKGHFDIGEIYARKLRKEILGRTFFESDFEDQIFGLHRKLCEQMDAYQDIYDAETDYSRNAGSQKTWIASIEGQLAGMNEFSDAVVKVRFKK